MRGHIDKLSKNITIEIENKPLGAVQWDFVCSIPEAFDVLNANYEKGTESLFLYITNSCKRGCLNCSKDKGKYELDFQKISALIRTEAKNKLKYVILDGDPTCTEKIYDYIDLFNELKLSYSVNTFSKLDEKFLEYVKNTICKIQFKLDDVEQTEYLKDVVYSLKMCKKYGIYTGIIFSITQKNWNKINEMIEFCKKYSVKQFSFSRLPSCQHIDKEYEFINSMNYLELSKELAKLRESETKIHITSNDAIWKGCGACTTTATIFANGDVVPCAFLTEGKGNIYKESLDTIWHNKVFQDIRTSHLEGKCGKCRYKILCKGCRAVAFKEKGNYLAEDGGCWIEN